MRSTVSACLVLAGSVLFASCARKDANTSVDSRPTIQNTVFTAQTPSGESFISPVEGNRTNEVPPRYLARHGFGNLGIMIGYQYIGKGFLNETAAVDVYLVSLKMGDKATEYECVIYEGGRKVVIDRPEVVVSLDQNVLGHGIQSATPATGTQRDSRK